MENLKIPIDWSKIPNPNFLQGNSHIAYRDPAGHYCNGIFRVFHTRVIKGLNGIYYSFIALTESRDLINWTEPKILTPKDNRLNYSSPGNVIRYGNQWMLCVQTYPTIKGQYIGDKTARIYLMYSNDLTNWSNPKLIPVKGQNVPVKKMGRMIDPYLIEDKDLPGKWWCFYKQDGASMSYTYDFRTWRYSGRMDSGENVCLIVNKNEYILFHSPHNGVGVKRSKDLKNWTDHELLTFGQPEWEWSLGRLTAGHVLDLHQVPEIKKFIMFFHGEVSKDIQPPELHGNASLALAWSDDLINWNWPGKP